MSWDPELGWWTLVDRRWLYVGGTTPRNAGLLTVDVRVGAVDLWTWFGEHTGIQLWLGGRGSPALQWRSRRCSCLSCQRER